MKCKHCNSEIEKDALFCPNCGEKVIRGRQCFKCGEELETDSDFCPYCGTRQTPEPQESSYKGRLQKDSSRKKNDGLFSNPWVIVLLMVLLCILLYLLFFNSHSNKSDEDDPEQEEVVSEEKSNLAGSDSVSLESAIEQQQKEDSLMKVAKLKTDSLAYLKDSLNNLSKNKQPSKSQTAKPESSSSRHTSTASRQTPERRSVAVQSGTKNLGYGTYKGNLVAGQPHGVNGRLIFKTSHLIDSRDSKGRVAEPGDYVIGEFYEGHLVQGIWYDANNQVKGSIIIGR